MAGTLSGADARESRRSRRRSSASPRASPLHALPAAGRLARGGGRRPAPAVPGRGLLGAAGARLRRPGGAAGDRRARARRRTAPTAPGGCSPAIAPASGCTGRCTGPGTRPGRAPSAAATGSSCATPTSPPWSAARRRPTGPTTAERDECLPWLVEELRLLPRARALLALGSFAWDGALRALRELGHPTPRPRPRFGHGAEAGDRAVPARRQLPPSQQNTFTGKLTREMLDAAIARAGALSREPAA